MVRGYSLCACLLCMSFFVCNVDSFLVPFRSFRTSIATTRWQLEKQQVLMSKSENEESSAGSIRFAGSTATVDNPIDYILSWVASDVGSIVLGLGGLIFLLVGRLVLDNDQTTTVGENNFENVEAISQATRSNLIAVFACCAVLLNGLGKLDVESRTAPTVVLQGTTLPEPAVLDTNNNLQVAKTNDVLTWVLESLLKATPAKTAVWLIPNGNQAWEIAAMAGVLPSLEPMVPSRTNTPIINKSSRSQSPNQQRPETYLPTLQVLPGRTEFTYLPINTQAVLLLPTVSDGVLVLGSDRARSWTPRDIAWSQLVVARLDTITVA